MQLGILKNTALCVAFYSGFGIATEVTKGTRRCMLHRRPKKRECLRPALTTLNLLLLSRHLSCQRGRRRPKLCQLGVLHQEKEPPQVARSRQKKKETHRTRRKKRTMRMLTRRMLKGIWMGTRDTAEAEAGTHLSLSCKSR